MTEVIRIEPITQREFSRFGDVVDTNGKPDMLINRGLCKRYHDRARLDFVSGRAGLSLFKAELRNLPLQVEMVERHPYGSQSFVPMSMHGFLVIVAPDNDGVPGRPRAFGTGAGQAINFCRGTWHGVLTPIAGEGLFAVIDRVGDGRNLEEHWFETEYVVEPG